MDLKCTQPLIIAFTSSNYVKYILTYRGVTTYGKCVTQDAAVTLPWLCSQSVDFLNIFWWKCRQPLKKLEGKNQYTSTIKTQRRPYTNYNLETDPTATDSTVYLKLQVARIYVNSQLDATITDFIDNYNQHSMFRAIISPILKSTRLRYNAPAMLPALSTVGTLHHKQ